MLVGYPSDQSRRDPAAAHQLVPIILSAEAHLYSIKKLCADRCHALEELRCVFSTSTHIQRDAEFGARLEAPSMTFPQPLTLTVTPLCAPKSCKSPFKGYMTSGAGANTINGLSLREGIRTPWLPLPLLPSPADEGLVASLSEIPRPLTTVSGNDGGGGLNDSNSEIPSPRRTG